MIICKEINLDEPSPLTEEQKQMLKNLEDIEPEPSEDCPELTEEQYKQLIHISKMSHLMHKQQSISLPLSPKALKKAKSLGEEYISILSKILEKILDNPELVKTFL